ncbi:hypothetical protein CPC08DRAFT_644265, partial [Agrocybe pediades]
QFRYHKKYEYSTRLATRLEFYCAQNASRQKKPKKGVKEGIKMRDKGAMDTFHCNGWLNIVVRENSPTVLMSLQHKEKHIAYWWIDVPKDIQEFVKENSKLTMDQLWHKVLKRNGNPAPQYTRKAIYHIWSEYTSKQWKRDPSDEVKLAKILIDEAHKKSDSIYQVEPITLPEEEGFMVVMFALPDMLCQWGGRIREISLGSAWNTNGLHYEVYALLGEVYGSGCPLGYLLIHSSDGDTEGKERYISQLLNYFKNAWQLKALFTLTDKDFSEINVFQNVFPEAKHQLPKYYDVKEAKKEFSWIDESFIPVVQMKDTDREKVSTLKGS